MMAANFNHDDRITGNEHAAVINAIARAVTACDQTGKAGIAATVLQNGRIISEAENEVHLQSDPTRHAEMVAIHRAAHALETTDLTGCVLISTLQPCEMCLSAMRFAGIDRVIFAATKARVASKYFVFPHLELQDFQRSGGFDAIGGICENRVLHLYADGAE
ncbi:MAG: nucleoside deaminase [Loktanella sp.]|nr:nucleoside deaminase [Loktanella sp.]